MKRAILISLLAMSAHAQEFNPDKIADAIYRAEGGANARVPYGILTVKIGDTFEARHVCITTVRNNWQRWREAGGGRPQGPGDFIDFLADHYCPPSVDPAGNANWKHNVRFFLK